MEKCNFNPSLGCGGSVKIKRLIKLLKIWAEFDENLEKTPKTALYLNPMISLNPPLTIYMAIYS